MQYTSTHDLACSLAVHAWGAVACPHVVPCSRQGRSRATPLATPCKLPVSAVPGKEGCGPGCRRCEHGHGAAFGSSEKPCGVCVGAAGRRCTCMHVHGAWVALGFSWGSCFMKLMPACYQPLSCTKQPCLQHSAGGVACTLHTGDCRSCNAWVVVSWSAACMLHAMCTGRSAQAPPAMLAC